MTDLINQNTGDGESFTIISNSSFTETIHDLSALTAKTNINLDFGNIDEMLKGCRYAVMTSAVGEGQHRILDAIDKIRASSVWYICGLQSATKLLIVILNPVESVNAVTADDLKDLMSFTSSLPATIDFRWCLSEDTSLDDNIKVIIIAADMKKVN